MSTQYHIEFSGSLPVSAQEGIQRSYEHSDPRWREWFDRCVMLAAVKKPIVTCDDVLDELETLPEVPKTHDLSALGGAMVRAANSKTGVLRPTGERVRSTRNTERNHANLRMTYRSLVYRGGE